MQKQKALNLLGLATRARKLISGTDTVIAGLKKKQVKIVIVASDLHENSDVFDTFTSEELNHAIGKNRKVLGVTDAGFSKSIVKQINEGV